MSSSQANRPPRRKRVKGDGYIGVYERYDGKYEYAYTDGTGKLRWKGPFKTKTAARKAREDIAGQKARGEDVTPVHLKFGEVADRWLAEQVADLRPTTRACYTSYVENHLRERWGNRKLDSIDVPTAAKLARELRAAGLAEWTIAGIQRVANRIFKFAARHCKWKGQNPMPLLESGNGERAKISDTPERRIYRGDELQQVLTASGEPWKTLFKLASVIGGRESELLGLVWADLDLSDPDAATIRFTHQTDRKGQRVELKTAESKAVLPLPRSAVVMMLEHRARSTFTGEQAFVFATRSGRALSQRNVLRALYRAQETARDAEGRPTFPELFEHDERGHLAVDEKGRYILRNVSRKDVALPDFHSFRHSAAMDCDDAEEARDLLRHKNSNVTRAVYRGHFSDKRRESLRAKMEARHGSPRAESRLERTDRSEPQQSATAEGGNVRQLRR